MFRTTAAAPRGARVALGLALSLAWTPAAAAREPTAEDLWARLQRGHLVVLLRHAAAPGTFDPPGFRLEDCATQRNLSEAGRAQARRIGDELRARGIRVGPVRSSRWCRARDTAQLAFGRHDPWPDLDSPADVDRGEVERRVARIREAVAAWSGPGTLVLVTHQFLVSELAGRSLGEGEMLVLEPEPDGFSVLGALTPAP